MYLAINKCVTAVKVSNFSGHYLRNRSTLDIGVWGYIGILSHKEHSPEVWHIPPGTACIMCALHQAQQGNRITKEEITETCGLVEKHGREEKKSFYRRRHINGVALQSQLWPAIGALKCCYFDKDSKRIQ
jgi:hypothetical protein